MAPAVHVAGTGGGDLQTALRPALGRVRSRNREGERDEQAAFMPFDEAGTLRVEPAEPRAGEGQSWRSPLAEPP